MSDDIMYDSKGDCHSIAESCRAANADSVPEGGK